MSDFSLEKRNAALGDSYQRGGNQESLGGKEHEDSKGEWAQSGIVRLLGRRLGIKTLSLRSAIG
jgi:hypothetical protein